MAGDSSQAGFAELGHDLALQIAALAPRYITQADIPAEAVEAEKNSYLTQLAAENKPDHIKERIIEGKLKKWYSQVVLLNQEFIKDSDLTIAQLLENSRQELGSELNIRRFTRFELVVN